MTSQPPHRSHADLLHEYLEEACRELDQRRAVVTPWAAFSRRAAAVPLAVGLAMGLAGCGSSSDSPNHPAAGGVGNSGQAGSAGAQPQQVAGVYGMPVYAAPSYAETNCTDGLDNNGNGLIDCKDPTCHSDIACQSNSAGSGGQAGQAGHPQGVAGARPVYVGTGGG